MTFRSSSRVFLFAALSVVLWGAVLLIQGFTGSGPFGGAATLVSEKGHAPSPEFADEFFRLGEAAAKVELFVVWPAIFVVLALVYSFWIREKPSTIQCSLVVLPAAVFCGLSSPLRGGVAFISYAALFFATARLASAARERLTRRAGVTGAR